MFLRNLVIAVSLSLGSVCAFAQLNDTGQTQCVNNSDSDAVDGADTVDCNNASAIAGQDAKTGRDASPQSKIGAGRTGTAFDFTKICMNGSTNCTGPLNTTNTPAPTDWACTKDNVSGLIWSMEILSDSISHFLASYSFMTEMKDRCGISKDNWRVPSRHELIGIVDYGLRALKLDTDYFSVPDTNAFLYWSKDPNRIDGSNLWYVDFGSGVTNYANGATTELFIRLVSGEEKKSTYTTDTGNQTVVDNMTKLMWDRCAYGYTGGECTENGQITRISWTNALKKVQEANANNYKGYNDWRLPNVKELESLIDMTNRNGTDLSIFPNHEFRLVRVWSSTSYLASLSTAYYMYVFEFKIDNTTKAGLREPSIIRLVRDHVVVPPPAGTTVTTTATVDLGPTGKLNDTGITKCYDDTQESSLCTLTLQDSKIGRDSTTMSKIGGGVAGFDFTKMCWNGYAEGSENCKGTLIANTSPVANTTSPKTDWACTKDNVTGLVWSLETVSNVAWQNTTSISNNRCNLNNTGWRLPTRHELNGIAYNATTSPAIDINYFPNTKPSKYWTKVEHAQDKSKAWFVDFINGGSQFDNKTTTSNIRYVNDSKN